MVTKVGNLNMYRSCWGLLDIYISNYPDRAMCTQFTMLLINVTIFVTWAYICPELWNQLLVIICTVVNTAIYIKLCLGDPGIAP